MNVENAEEQAQESEVNTSSEASGFTFSMPNEETQQAEANEEKSQEASAEQQATDLETANALAEAERVASEQAIEDAKTQQAQPIELDDEKVINYLKEKKGVQATNLDEVLTPKEQKKYAPELEKFQEFIEKTGNTNFNDFQETQKDWSTVTEEERLKTYLKLSNPSLDAKEVNHLYNKKYDISALDPEDDENEIVDRGINIKTDLANADKFFEKRKEEFNVVRGTDEHIPIEYREAVKTLEGQKQRALDYDLLVQDVKNDTAEKAEKLFSPTFEGFKFKVEDENQAIEEIVFKSEDVQDAKKWHADPNNLNDLFFDDAGKLKSPEDFFAIAEIARIGVTKFVQQIRNTATANLIEKQDKISKNIEPENQAREVNQVQSGYTFSATE